MKKWCLVTNLKTSLQDVIEHEDTASLFRAWKPNSNQNKLFAYNVVQGAFVQKRLPKSWNFMHKQEWNPLG